LKMIKNGLEIPFESNGNGLVSYIKELLIAFMAINVLMVTFHLKVMASGNSSFDKKAIEDVINGKNAEANASWWGFNEEDSTQALQAAISSKAKRIIVPNMGKPWVVESIFLESDKEIIFEKGVIVVAKLGAFKGRRDTLFRANNKRNIVLSGYCAEFIMWKQDYMQAPYEKGEWRSCISIYGTQNIKVYGLQLANSGGDGIYISGGVSKENAPNSDNIYIKDVICDNHYRQGISIISASNLLIENCVFQNTKGTPPQAGIDFEPNRLDEVLINCKVKNCLISDNYGVGIAIYVSAFNKTSKPISIEIEGCQVLRNKQGSISIAGKTVNNIGDPKGNISIRNCKIDGQVEQRKAPMLDVRFEEISSW
jgi:hypothetical protein